MSSYILSDPNFSDGTHSEAIEEIETLSAEAIAALVRNLRRNGFLMSALDASPKEWIVERIDPRGLPVVTDDVIREAEERALDLG
jgi:hypothetical protein